MPSRWLAASSGAAVAAAAPAAGREWLAFSATNCYTGMGAVSLPEADPLPGHRDLPMCQEECMKNPECEAIQLLDTGDATSDNCYFRKRVKIEQCEWCPKMGVWLAPKEDFSNSPALSVAWRSIPGINCYPGRGASYIVDRDSLPGHMRLDQCEKACLEHDDCQGFVWHDYKDASHDNCYLRGNIRLADCNVNKAWNLRLRPGTDLPGPLPPKPAQPTPAPAPAPAPRPPPLRFTMFGSTTASIPCCNQYRGVASVGGRAVFPPFYARSIGVFDALTHAFSTVDISGEVEDTVPLYSGAVSVGDKVVLAPWDASAIGIFDTAKSAFSTVNIASQVKTPSKYSGATAVGDSIVFSPYWADAIGIFDLKTETFVTRDISSEVPGVMRFSEPTSAGRKIVFPPFDAPCAGVFDMAHSKFSTVDVTAALGERGDKFSGAASVGATAVFAPYKAKAVGVLDTESMTFSTVDISSQVEMDDALFSGAVAYDGKVYFAPDEALGCGVFDVATSKFSMVSLGTTWDDPMKFMGAAVVTGESPMILLSPASTKIGYLSPGGDAAGDKPLRLTRLDADLSGGGGAPQWTARQSWCAIFAGSAVLGGLVVASVAGLAARRSLGPRGLHLPEQEGRFLHSSAADSDSEGFD